MIPRGGAGHVMSSARPAAPACARARRTAEDPRPRARTRRSRPSPRPRRAASRGLRRRSYAASGSSMIHAWRISAISCVLHRRRRGRRRLLDGRQRQHRPAGAHERHPLQLRPGQRLGLGRGVRDHRVRGDQDQRLGQRLRRAELAAVEVERTLGAAAGEEVRGEDVRQPERGGQRRPSSRTSRAARSSGPWSAAGVARRSYVPIVSRAAPVAPSGDIELLDRADVVREVVDAVRCRGRERP